MITCIPIGTVKCAVTEMSQGGWAKVESEIHLDRMENVQKPPWVEHFMDGHF